MTKTLGENMLDTTTIDGLLEAVRFAARTEILPRFRNLPAEDIFSKSHADDLVTVADQRSEKLIAEAAQDLLPKALVIGEEAVAEDLSLLDRMSGSELTVIIDPIDGTSNFATGIGVFGVILAVQLNGKTIFGLLYDPLGDDWVIASEGSGAFFQNSNGQSRRLTASQPKALEQTSGFIPLYLFSRPEQERIVSAYPRFKRINSLRCSCHEYRQMALGHVDFTLNDMAKPWDHAAGALILKETGGAVYTTDGAPYDPAAPKTPLWAFAWQDKSAQQTIETLLGV